MTGVPWTRSRLHFANFVENEAQPRLTPIHFEAEVPDNIPI